MKVGDLWNTGRMPQLKISDQTVIYLRELILYFCRYNKRNNEIKTMMIQGFSGVQQHKSLETETLSKLTNLDEVLVHFTKNP